MRNILIGFEKYQTDKTDVYNPSSDSHFSTQSVSLATVKGEFVLKSGEAAEMAALIEKNLNGLRQRSVYALAQQNTSKPGKSPQRVQCRIVGSNTPALMKSMHTRK